MRVVHLLLCLVVTLVCTVVCARPAVAAAGVAAGAPSGAPPAEPYYARVLSGEAQRDEEGAMRAMAARLSPGGRPVRLGAAGAALAAGSTSVVTIDTPDGERFAVVYVPESYATTAARGPVALQVLFHGLGDECGSFLEAVGATDFADRDGFIVASACGSVGLLGRGWNSGTCCGFLDAARPDDAYFARALVQALSGSLRVDAAKVMAVGFSNGAMLAEVLACESDSPFRAAASVGGVMELRPGGAGGQDACDALMAGPDGAQAQPRSLLFVHGDGDIKVPWGGYSWLGFSAQEENMRRWSDRLECQAERAYSTLSRGVYSNTIVPLCRSAPVRGQQKQREDGAREPSAGKPSTLALLLELEAQLRSGKFHADRMAPLQNATVAPAARRAAGAGAGGRGAATVRGVRGADPYEGHQFIEMVRVAKGGHTWPEDADFSTSQYIYEFGLRAFGSYNALK